MAWGECMAQSPSNTNQSPPSSSSPRTSPERPEKATAPKGCAYAPCLKMYAEALVHWLCWRALDERQILGTAKVSHLSPSLSSLFTYFHEIHKFCNWGTVPRFRKIRPFIHACMQSSLQRPSAKTVFVFTFLSCFCKAIFSYSHPKRSLFLPWRQRGYHSVIGWSVLATTSEAFSLAPH